MKARNAALASLLWRPTITATILPGAHFDQTTVARVVALAFRLHATRPHLSPHVVSDSRLPSIAGVSTVLPRPHGLTTVATRRRFRPSLPVRLPDVLGPGSMLH